MSKKRKILLMLAKGGVPQSEVAAALRVSKRDVSACARALRDRGLAFGDVLAMGAAEVDALLAPPGGRATESAYLQPDMGPLIERKRLNRRLTVKMFWMEHCEAAATAGKATYSYQTFCEMFASEHSTQLVPPFYESGTASLYEAVLPFYKKGTGLIPVPFLLLRLQACRVLAHVRPLDI